MGLSQKDRWAARAEQRESWAAAADARAAEIDASMPAYARDPAFMTQPGNIPQRLRDKLTARERMAHDLREKAAAHRAAAVELRRLAGRNKGDAEAVRERARAQISERVEVGAFVDSIYGVRRVARVNAKSLRLEGRLGSVTIDKSLCRLVPQCCGSCASWRRGAGLEGECWSADRLDGDLSKGPASETLPTSACEAWFPA